jgi:glutathionyl-hydroquinone reductase
MLVDGIWQAKWQPVQSTDGQGGFVRLASQFRNWITPDGAPGPQGEGGFPAEAGRYHLYVALICPWASRTLLVRKLKGLERVIGVTVTEPQLTDEGWRFGEGFPGSMHDELNGAVYVHQLYTLSDPHCNGRATVPVLWDKKRRVIVNNESAEIVRMLNSAFNAFADQASQDLYPAELREEIDRWNDWLYPNLNNGVYRAGFATTQGAYDEAVRDVFGALDALETRLADGRLFFFGERLTESDIRLFVTLIRFDAAYHGLFKCNRRPLGAYPSLARYTRRMYDLPGVAETVSLEHIVAGYYSIEALNPRRIIPGAPDLPYLR